jgi:hypothetical protein
MKFSLAALALLSAIMVGSPATAEVSESWRINYSLAGHPIALDCRFESKGAQLGGVCVNVATGDPKVRGGTAHPLTRGAVNGTQISWAYEARMMLAKFEVNFAGVVDGARMAGTVNVAGRKGEFTGVRK